MRYAAVDADRRGGVRGHLDSFLLDTEAQAPAKRILD
jgi:hypothetical protein